MMFFMVIYIADLRVGVESVTRVTAMVILARGVLIRIKKKINYRKFRRLYHLFFFFVVGDILPPPEQYRIGNFGTRD